MFKKLNLIFISFLLLAVLAPLGSLAADDTTGQIIISIVDEDKNNFPGMWYLRQGGINGAVVRNGTYGENFNYNPGIYYLQVHPKNYDHPYYLLSSTNPQTLVTGGSINFQIQYFKTEADKLVAEAIASQSSSSSSSGGAVIVAPSTKTILPDLIVSSFTHSPTAPTTTDKVTFTVVVKNQGTGSAGASMLSFQIEGITSSPKYYSVPGLKSGETYTITQQEALTTAKSYTANVKADTYNDVKKEADETNNAGKDAFTVTVAGSTTSTSSSSTSSSTTSSYVYAPQFSTPPSTSTTVPTFSTPSTGGLGGVPKLAATGPATLALLALAPIMGGLAVRRKK